MYGLLLGILILDGIMLMVIILLQSGKGGGLAAMGGGAGTDTFMGGRQAATFLTRATWAAGGLFLVLSVVLAVLSSRRQEPSPLLEGQFQQQGEMAQPQPVLPGLEEGAEEEAEPAEEPPPQP